MTNFLEKLGLVDEGFYWFKRVTVDGTGAESVEGGDVGWIVVSEVGFKAVAGVGEGGFLHESVSGDFCEN